MNTVKFQNDSYTLPENWNEMLTKQLEQAAKVILTNIYPVWLLVRLALSFMGMRLSNKNDVTIDGEQYFYIRHGWRKIYLINSTQMHEVSQCVGFLLNENQLVSNLTKNPYPVIEWRCKRLFGPADCFANLRFGEFIQAEIERDLYLKNNEINHYHRMLAILWRPTCWKPDDGDLRAPLRMDSVGKRAKRIGRLPDYKQKVMQWYYDGCLLFLYNQFPSVFSQGESKSSISAFESFMKMVNMLAENKLFNVEATRESYLFDALFTLQEIIEKHENQPK